MNIIFCTDPENHTKSVVSDERRKQGHDVNFCDCSCPANHTRAYGVLTAIPVRKPGHNVHFYDDSEEEDAETDE